MRSCVLVDYHRRPLWNQSVLADGDTVPADNAQRQVDAGQGRHAFGIRAGGDHHDGRCQRAVIGITPVTRPCSTKMAVTVVLSRTGASERGRSQSTPHGRRSSRRVGGRCRR